MKFLQIVTLVLFEKSFPSKNGYFDSDFRFSSSLIEIMNPSGINFLNKKLTMSEFSELIIVISVGEFRYRFITFSKYPKANGFSAAEVPFDSSICFDILRNVSLCVR